MHIPEEEIHYHTHADGTVHAHSHGHTHTHTHTQTKAVINRLSRAIGHLESVKRMVESGRDCSACRRPLRIEQYGKGHTQGSSRALHCGRCRRR